MEDSDKTSLCLGHCTGSGGVHGEVQMNSDRRQSHDRFLSWSLYTGASSVHGEVQMNSGGQAVTGQVFILVTVDTHAITDYPVKSNSGEDNHKFLPSSLNSASRVHGEVQHWWKTTQDKSLPWSLWTHKL